MVRSKHAFASQPREQDLGDFFKKGVADGRMGWHDHGDGNVAASAAQRASDASTIRKNAFRPLNGRDFQDAAGP